MQNLVPNRTKQYVQTTKNNGGFYSVVSAFFSGLLIMLNYERRKNKKQPYAF